MSEREESPNPHDIAFMLEPDIMYPEEAKRIADREKELIRFRADAVSQPNKWRVQNE